jgi:ATP-binding cassette subfamily B protein
MLDAVRRKIALSNRGGEIRGATVHRALGYLRPYRGAVAAALGCLLVQSVLAVAPFLIVERLINHLEAPRTSFSTIVLLAAAGLGLVVAGGAVGVLRGWIVLRITTRIVADIRRQLVERLLGQSLGYFTGVRGGDLMSRLLNDVNVVEGALGDSTLSLLGSAITAVVCMAVMAVVQWRLALVTVAILPPMAFAMRRVGRPIYRTRRELQESLAAFTTHAQEVLGLSGIMLVKSFGREATERERSHRLAEELRQADMRAGMTARWIGFGFQFGQSLAPIVLILTGAWLIEHDYASLGTVVAFAVVLALRFGAALGAVGSGAVTVLGALPAWDRVFTVLDAHVEIQERPGAMTYEQALGAVRFEDVSYSYPRQSRPAVDGVSLDVAPGQLVALVGPSGAGKTTLTSLLARFHEPQQGSIQIDGHDLRSLKLQSVAEAVGLVLQETYLFHGTLRENLLYARPDADQAVLIAACRDAYLDAVVEELPDGLDTIVGERGHRLSGGEKQRVAIARVILKDSPILILDEATSHLDTASERHVQAALARVFAGRTSFVIAHRLSTVLAADVIVVLDRGRIVEQGTHLELVVAGGLYASLYELQFRARDPRPTPSARDVDDDARQTKAGRPGGVAAGLAFLAAVRRDPDLRERLAGIEPEAGLDRLVLFAAEAGFSLSADDLRAAFGYDWGLRRAHYLRAEVSAESAATTVAVVHTPQSGM